MKLQFITLIILSITSTNALAGTCQCPDDRMKNGHRCGEISAFCRPGGEEPMCGAKDEKEKKELFKKLCPNTYKSLRKIES